MDTRTRDSLVLDFVRRRFREAGGEADGDIFIRSVFYLGAGWRRHRLFGNQRVSLRLNYAGCAMEALLTYNS